MDVAARIHEQLSNCGIKLAASLPDDWVAPLIERIATDNRIRHVRVAREAEAIAICSGAFFGGVRAVALMGATGLLTCTGELATLNLRHQIPVFLIVSQRGSIDDHRIYQEVQGRPDDVSSIPDAFETCRMQKRPFVLFLTRRLVKGEGTA
jgi:sulfopyruvate decarboxylase TPP-binding subunit